MKRVDEMTDDELGVLIAKWYDEPDSDSGFGARVRALFTPHPRSRQRDDGLAEVRADIMRTAAVVQALGTVCVDTPIDAMPESFKRECEEQRLLLQRLLVRERALME